MVTDSAEITFEVGTCKLYEFKYIVIIIHQYTYSKYHLLLSGGYIFFEIQANYSYLLL